MKIRCPANRSGMKAPRSAIIVSLMTALLCACATEKPVNEVVAPNVPVASAAPVAVITREVRNDFDTAMTHIKAEEYDAAIEILTKVVQAVPNAAVPHIDIALAYEQTGKLKQAEESLQLALGAEPDNPVANSELALLYRKTGRFSQSRQLYEKILDRYPDYRMVRKNLGILCDLYLKDYACAIKHYEFYSSVVQDDGAVKIWIADLQKRLGKQE